MAFWFRRRGLANEEIRELFQSHDVVHGINAERFCGSLRELGGGGAGAGAPAATAKAITAYSFVGFPGAAGTIDEAAKTIALTVPNGTAVTALVATFTTTGTG